MLRTGAIKADFGFSGRVGDYYYRCYSKRMGFYYIHCRQKFKIFKVKTEPRGIK